MLNKKEEYILSKITTMIKICTKNGTIIGRATGFFCKNESDELFLVTNNHVINRSKYIKIYLTLRNNITNEIEFKNYLFDISDKILKHNKYDLCVIKFQQLFENLKTLNYIPIISYIPYSGICKDFSAFNKIEKLLMVGYPGSIINNENNFPVIRECSTSSGLCDSFDEKEIFLTNITSNKGASGSPLFHINEFGKVQLVGIHFEGYYEKHPIYINTNRQYYKRKIGHIETPIGIGASIKSSVLLELL